MEQYDTVIISHGGCNDGLASSWCFYHFNNRKESSLQSKIRFHFTKERDFSKDTRMPDLTNKHVIILDYSYSSAVIKKISAIAKSFILIDHHSSAYTNLLNEPNCHFDLTKAAAQLSWEHCCKVAGVNEPLPWFIGYICDRDLWTWELPNSKEFSEALKLTKPSFQLFDTLYNYDESEQKDFIIDGKVAYNVSNGLASDIARTAYKVRFLGYDIYVAQSVVLRSEAGNILAERPDCHFSMIYNYNLIDDLCWVSLRGADKIDPFDPSDDKKVIDLSVIAKKFPEGGGHPQAAGFTWYGNITTLFKQFP
jgi:oligoribonuclease NrnB/cAMP/cGMP phosphodiesterase (DHH superfamily)